MRVIVEIRSRQLAEDLLMRDDAPDIPPGAWLAAVRDLAEEIKAAVDDRWNDWKQAREAGLSIGIGPAERAVDASPAGEGGPGAAGSIAAGSLLERGGVGPSSPAAHLNAESGGAV